ncbi:forkhead domain-containing protein [Verticillium alfalfae VaMs.102]|uniref:Forkhead domain-containing protein n=1 Tax=Verticillium alfalfae (strain VaMs.102 / ATCC MYA-4576 / FGSC 10136) TaxID=526221 RepID=C9SGN7_VERA1|nr:forkhead domain-containing protein [Verticillium alfalfae VaMs.102]EEY18159.1 forkhead domain-containing protein [Verticillium alfalfae VaMs.102]
MTSSQAGQSGQAPELPMPIPTTPPPKSKPVTPMPATAAPATPTAAATTTTTPPPPLPSDQPSATVPAGSFAASDMASADVSVPTAGHPMDSLVEGVTSESLDTDMPDAQPSLDQQQTQQQNNQGLQNNRHRSQSHTRSSNLNPFDVPFPRTPISALDANAYMAMALAQMAGDSMMQHQMAQPPSTVTPAQVTLPSNLTNGADGVTARASNLPDAGEGLESFARIEFADSVFQMTTYAVIIGRDQRALEQARRDERRAEEHRRRAAENERLGLPPPSPVRHDRGKFSKSYVSEEGGMLGPESDSDETGRPKKRRKTSTNDEPEHQEADQSQENLISNRQYISHTPGAAAVDLASLRPSPYHVPIIGIHSPGPDIASKTKAISREHVRIQFNQKESVFEAIPLHKNGFFVGDVLHKEGTVVLRSGDTLQIKDVDFRFLINGVPEGKTGAEEEVEEERMKKKRYSEGGKEMSFEFEASHGNGQLQDTSDSSSVLSPPAPSDDEDSEAEAGDARPPKAAVDTTAEADLEAMDADADADADADMDAPAEPEHVQVKGELGMDPQPEMLLPPIPKKRGPGRPPKNGIMSKREQRLLKKQAQEMARKTLPQPPPGEPPIKRKVGRPRKHPLPEDGGDRPEKRKYKPRKPKEEGGEGSDAERRAKEKKDKKVRPKSPPLELKIEDYTEEQLQKPNKNYGVLIDETLTAAHAEGRAEGLTLKQIYKRITLKYPWFYFHTETKGWESSVRHNLIGNEAFKKDDTTGLWSRVPGVELDAGKKRKATSPDRTLAPGYGPYAHPMYPPYTATAPHMAPAAPGAPTYQHQPQAYHPQTYNAQQPQPARPPQYSPPGSVPVASQAPQPVPAQPVAPAQLPGYGPAPAGVAQTSTYSSPYASRPPPANPAVKTEDGTAQVHGPPAAQAPALALPGVPIQPQPATNPQAASTAQRVTQTPPLQSQQRHVIEPRLFRSVLGLKNGLVENMKKAKSPKGEAIVMSALNRCLGLKAAATENPALEDICMRGIQKVLDGYSGQSKSPTPGEPATAKANGPGSVFDPKVFAALVGFKNVSTNALKATVGESVAEAVALSAIDRVLGLAEASIVPPKAPPRDGSPPEASKQSSYEVIETRLMANVRQMLLGLNQKLHGA